MMDFLSMTFLPPFFVRRIILNFEAIQHDIRRILYCTAECPLLADFVAEVVDDGS
jgi:hypothetical protein